jgi:transcriptional regulator with XRE-family HTH domain
MGRYAFGVALRQCREKLQLTQEALAHRSGISVRTLRDLEAGRTRRPRGDSLRLLADALDVTAEHRVEFAEKAAHSLTAQRLVPRQLPADIAGFVGRAEPLAILANNLRAVMDTDHSAPVISSISGMAGIGKTALAVHWAHRIAPQFPDGQLYVDLRGHTHDAPMPSTEALARFLRALGALPDQVPAEADEAAALYRSLLAERRVLVILDNAANAAQVRPLLPASSASLILITSRTWLFSLIAMEGANAVRLGVLSPKESADLLSRRIGADRLATEPHAAARLAHLPLALRVAAAKLADDPHSSITDLLDELSHDSRLDALQVAGGDESALRAAL